MVDNDQNSDLEENFMEFDFPLPLNKISENLAKLHVHISNLLDLPNDEELNFIFTTAASLCDPFTQPEENEKCLLSIDCLSDVLIAIAYKNHLRYIEEDSDIDINSIKFTLSTKFFSLLRNIHILLNAFDELQLRYVDNDEEQWIESLPKWTPLPGIARDEYNLKLVYSIACVLIVSIYKLFKPVDGPYNLSLNPYMQFFIKLWKCHTNIILLGIEIDRRIEADNYNKEDREGSPDIVLNTMRGSSAVRYVLAWIINQNPTLLNEPDEGEVIYPEDIDIKDETLINFTQPCMRKRVNGGSLLIDMRLVVISMLIINLGLNFTAGKFKKNKMKESEKNHEKIEKRRINQSNPYSELGDILIDLEYDDRFDEDVRYVFEYEYDEMEEEWPSPEKDSVTSENDGSIDNKEAGANSSISTAVRQTEENAIEFDELGRDWRDLPRGENANFQSDFLKKVLEYNNLDDKSQSDDFLSTWEELSQSLSYLCINSIEDDLEAEQKLGQVVINTISNAIKNEVEKKKSSISPDLIYKYWASAASEEEIQETQENNKLIIPIYTITKFELLMLNNSKLARCLMDEMLMCNGYRRVLIWFLTHNINLSTLLIDYIFELLVGLRGDDNRQKPYTFTRCGGKIPLSEIEELMLLHEFLTNCCIYLSATDGIEIDDGYKVVLAESIAKKYMTLMCLMINQLINLGIIDLSPNKTDDDDHIHDYSNELQVLLINWVGKLPVARELFFKVKNSQYEVGETTPTQKLQVEEVINDDEYNEEQRNKLIEKYSSMTSNEISEDLEKNKANLNTIKAYTKLIEDHILTVIHSHVTTTPQDSTLVGRNLTDLNNDFSFFFSHFNTLSKIEIFSEELFEKFEPFITIGEKEATKQGIDKPDDIPELVSQEEVFESEFNEDFLNGDVNFKNKTPAKHNKKKSKKKKSRKK